MPAKHPFFGVASESFDAINAGISIHVFIFTMIDGLVIGKLIL